MDMHVDHIDKGEGKGAISLSCQSCPAAWSTKANKCNLPWKDSNEWYLHIWAWASILRSASALAARTSSEVDISFGNTHDCTSGNCSASKSASGEITFEYVTCKLQLTSYKEQLRPYYK